MAALPLAGYLDGIQAELIKLAPAAGALKRVSAVHKARVATRRLGAALEMLHPILSDDAVDPLHKALRKLRRRLGPARDVDVMLEHLGEFKSGKSAGKTPAHRAAGELAADLRRKRGKLAREGDLPGKLMSRLARWRMARQQLLESSAAVDGLIASSVRAQLDAFASASDGLVRAHPGGAARRTASKGSPAGSDHAPDIHGVRIAGKHLRYTLEMAQAQGHDIPSKLLKTFKSMQDALGLWHDHAVLAETALTQIDKRDLVYHDAPAAGGLADLAAQSLAKAADHLAEFVRLWKTGGKTLTGLLKQRYPLSQPVNAGDAGLVAPVEAAAVRVQTIESMPDTHSVADARALADRFDVRTAAEIDDTVDRPTGGTGDGSIDGMGDIPEDGSGYEAGDRSGDGSVGRAGDADDVTLAAPADASDDTAGRVARHDEPLNPEHAGDELGFDSDSAPGDSAR